MQNCTRHHLSSKIFARYLEIGEHTFIIWKIVLHGRGGKLLSEAVDLVQEEDDTGLDKPPRITYAVEKSQSFLHSIYRFVLHQQLIIFADSHEEEDSGNILETMNPFFSF